MQILAYVIPNLSREHWVDFQLHMTIASFALALLDHPNLCCGFLYKQIFMDDDVNETKDIQR